MTIIISIKTCKHNSMSPLLCAACSNSSFLLTCLRRSIIISFDYEFDSLSTVFDLQPWIKHQTPGFSSLLANDSFPIQGRSQPLNPGWARWKYFLNLSSSICIFSHFSSILFIFFFILVFILHTYILSYIWSWYICEDAYGIISIYCNKFQTELLPMNNALFAMNAPIIRMVYIRCIIHSKAPPTWWCGAL